MTMAERIAIMHLGWIAQVGSPMDIYETPASRLVCEFIGNVNLFDGELIEDMGDHAVIASPGLENPIYVGHGISTRAQDKQITYAIRPEKLLIGTELPELERDRKSVVSGKSVSVRVDFGGCSILSKKYILSLFPSFIFIL